MDPLSAYYRQLGGMLEAGMPILSALSTVSGQVQDGRLCSASRTMSKSIESGQTLYDAMSKHPKLFETSTLAMVRAGQTAGRLSETFKELAILVESRAAVRSRIRKAMIYPCFMTFIALLIGGGCLFILMPLFENVYSGEGVELPALTRVLIDTRVFVIAHWLIITVGLIVLAAAMKILRASATVRIVTDGLLLHVPIAGTISRKISTAGFSRMLSHQIRTGVAPNNAILLSAGVVRNRTLSLCLAGAANAVSRGEPMSTALEPTKALPQHVIDMLKSGEKTGRADDMLEHVAALTEQEVDAQLSALTALINPLLIVFVGLLVGVLAIGILAPIFNLSSLV